MIKFQKKYFSLHVLILVVILLATFAASYAYGAWHGYPQGYDAPMHLYKTQHILETWPNHHWWNIWAGGMPLFLYYPPLPHYIFALTNIVTGASLELLLTSASVLAVGFVSFAVYLLVFKLTNNKLFSFVSSLLYLSSPDSWAMSIKSGVYMRALAMPFFVFGLYFGTAYFRAFEKKSFDKKPLLLVSLFLGFTLMIHQFIAGIAYATLFFLMFFFIKGKVISRIVAFLKMVVLSFLLSSSFILPMIVNFPNNPSNSWIGPKAKQVVNIRPLSYLQKSFTDVLRSVFNFSKTSDIPPFFPILVVLLITIFLVRRLSGLKLHELKDKNIKVIVKNLFKKLPFNVRILLFSSSLIILWIIYGKAYLLNFSKIIPIIISAYAFLGTTGAKYFVPLFSSITLGLLLHMTLPKKRLVTYLFAGFMIFLSVMALKNQYYRYLKSFRNNNLPISIYIRDPFRSYGELTPIIKDQYKDNFRFALKRQKSMTALRFNNQFPTIPHIDHYFSPGVANFDLYFYFSEVLWKGATANETKFFLDWWGINTLVAGSSSTNSNNSDFKLLGKDAGVGVYNYKYPSPILSATNAPTILFIGKESSYQGSFFRTLALANLDSSQLISVIGKDTVDEYTSLDLSLFDVIVLYDYQINSIAGTALVLNDYVMNGGNLIIESSEAVKFVSSFPDPYPIREVNVTQRQGSWNFVLETTTPYITNVELQKFASPDFQIEEPWSIFEGIGVKPWAKTLISSEGKPVIIEGEFGKGKVLWSGLNLPFHVVNSKNNNELNFLKNILLEYSQVEREEKVNFQVDFINPQKRILKLDTQANGVLFKEAKFPNWKAVAKTAKGNRKLEIQKAGPGFMFAFLPEETEKVSFTYRRSYIEIISDLISILTFCWIIYELSFGKKSNK